MKYIITENQARGIEDMVYNFLKLYLKNPYFFDKDERRRKGYYRFISNENSVDDSDWLMCYRTIDNGLYVTKQFINFLVEIFGINITSYMFNSIQKWFNMRYGIETDFIKIADEDRDFWTHFPW